MTAANTLFQYLETFLKQDRVFDKAEAKLTMAEIHAQLGNTQQALTHIEAASADGLDGDFRQRMVVFGA